MLKNTILEPACPSQYRISVIITSYNQIEELHVAIESVLNQTLKAYEIIVCDDASSDGTQSLIKTYAQSTNNLVRGIYQKRNIGVSENRNAGLSAAKGYLITWLDGDDFFLPRKLELEAAIFVADTDVKWVYSQVFENNIDLKTQRLRYRKPCAGMIFDEVTQMLGRAPRNPMVELAVLKRIGFFDEKLQLYEDYDLCLRLSKLYKCAFQPQPAMEYRVHNSGLHSAPKEQHAQNLNLIHQNLIDLLNDVPTRQKHKLQNRFRYSHNMLFHSVLRSIRRNNKINAFCNLILGIIYNPKIVTDRRLYVILTKIILPKFILENLRRLKEAVIE